MHLLFTLIVFALINLPVNELTISPAPKTKNMTYLALGDSYTIGTSLDTDSNRFPVQLVDKLNRAGFGMDEPEIIATNGWTTGDLIRATDNFHPDSTYDLVSLLIGVNNQYRGQNIDDYSTDFRLLLERAIGYAGNDTSHVFVFSIPDYGVTPFGKKKDNTGRISTEIDRYNSVNRKIAEELGVSYFDITPISRKAESDPELIASDGLHPSGKMYELWINAYFERIKSKLADQD